MTALPTYRDDPARLQQRIRRQQQSHKGTRDLQRRLVIAKCRQIRREVRAEKKQA